MKKIFIKKNKLNLDIVFFIFCSTYMIQFSFQFKTIKSRVSYHIYQHLRIGQDMTPGQFLSGV